MFWPAVLATKQAVVIATDEAKFGCVSDLHRIKYLKFVSKKNVNKLFEG